MPSVYIRLAGNVHKINIIRDLRTCFSMSLYDAKHLSECLLEADGEPVRYEYSIYNIGSSPESIILYFNEKPFVNVSGKSHRFYRKETNNSSSKIYAIKDIRYALGLGLKEAKDIMDEMWGYNSSPKENWIHRDLSPKEVYDLKGYGFDVVSNVPAFQFNDHEEELFKF